MLKDLVLNTLVQWVLFLIIPLITYLVFFRKKENVFHFLGLKKPKKVRNILLLQTSLIGVAFVFISLSWFQKYNLGGEDLRLLSFLKTGMSFETILILLIQSVIRTSFLEEIVFRGFFINLLKDRFGFLLSNHFQALIFAALHIFAMLTFSIIDMVIGTIIIYLLSIYFGKITKESGYSVFYSTVFHGLLNIVAGLIFISRAI